MGHPDYAIEEGTVVCDGESLLPLPAELRSMRGLFLAFQSPVELPGVSIAQMLRAAKQLRLPKGETLDVLAFQDELFAALDRLAMERCWANRGVHEGCSGGEKKRCELLQILMLKPRYLLLDEMDSGLDREALQLVAHVLGELRMEGTGILLVTHQRPLLDLLAPNKILMLRGGRLVLSGGVEVLDAWEAGEWCRQRP